MANKNEKILPGFYDDGIFSIIAGKETDAVYSAFGTVGGASVYSVVQNGNAVCATDINKMAKAVKLAAKTGYPVVTFYNSVGARLDDGLASIVSYSKLNSTISKVSGVVPQIAVVTGVCGASAAIAASMADICIMSKEGELFLTPPFTSAAGGDKLNGAAGAAFAAQAEVVHIVTETTKEAVDAAAKLVSLLPSNNLTAPAEFDVMEPETAINLSKYSAENAALSLVDDASEIRIFAHCKEVYLAVAAVGGNAAGIVSTEKGDMDFAAVSMVTRFVRLCDSFNIPIITIVNTDGFTKTSSNDIAGGIRAASRLTATYSDATTAKISVITGKLIGTAYSAFCQSDLTIVLESAIVAPIEPSAAATIVYSEELANSKNITDDTVKLTAKYIEEYCSADKLMEQGLADFAVSTATLRTTLVTAVNILLTKRVQRLAKKYGNAT